MPDLNFIEEDIPTITRVGGSGAAPVEWENLLAPLKAPDKAGKSFRVWEYAKKTAASSRVAGVRGRLTEMVPEENWKLAVRAIPGSDPEMFGVYVSFQGTFTPAEVAQRADEREKRIAKIKAARAAAEQANAALPTEDAPKQTAAEKVAAAKKAQTTK